MSPIASWVVRGRVQGVGFRWAARSEADRLGVRGFVRNRFDGAVEVVAVGEEAVLERFRAWLFHGPRGAVVSAVEATDVPDDISDEVNHVTGFHIIR